MHPNVLPLVTWPALLAQWRYERKLVGNYITDVLVSLFTCHSTRTHLFIEEFATRPTVTTAMYRIFGGVLITAKHANMEIHLRTIKLLSRDEA